MASVKVAVRARPLNQREIDLQSRLIIDMSGNRTTITNTKIAGSGTSTDMDVGRERVKEFTYDFSYWSCIPGDPHFTTQEQVFEDLGKEVVENSFEGYNACIFAYGQTGSGKTFTMMGTPDNEGLIPRICQSLFSRMKENRESGTKFRTEVSYLEIYNERVKDLLRKNSSQHNLKVREHPKLGPYVQDLSLHYVMDYTDVQELMARGNANRTTAATAMNDVSSRSHAIFTLSFTQAKFHQDMPSETVSKVNLVDLAGSERADASGATGQRLKEGGHINKSLVTLGSVISALADLAGNCKRQIFIPYRDSVLTWLLKDSLGGNSKTIMIATISPAECNYGESLSTLRYASRAKSIINRPTINENANVKLIRELRAEIEYLKSMLQGSGGVKSSPQVMEKLQENEARVKALTQEWADKWREIHKILKEQQTLALRKSGAGVVLDSERPHLIGLDDDVLSTGITLYHLKEGVTSIGRAESANKQDIELPGVDIVAEHCLIEQKEGVVTLIPLGMAQCSVNTISIDRPVRLTHGCVILLGSSSMFRFNDPAEVQRLRKEKTKRSSLHSSRLSLFSQSLSDLAQSVDDPNNVNSEQNEKAVQALEEKRRHLEDLEREHRQAEEKRLREQEKFQAEMEEKQKQLEKLRQESEDMHRQVQQAQRKMEEDQRKLQRRSQDVEKQFQLYLQEKTRLEADRIQSATLLAQQQQQSEDPIPYDLFKARMSDLTRRKTELEWQREETMLQAEIESEQVKVLEVEFKRAYQQKVKDLSSFLLSLEQSPFRDQLLEHYRDSKQEFDSPQESVRLVKDKVKRELTRRKCQLGHTLQELQARLKGAETSEQAQALDTRVKEVGQALQQLVDQETAVDRTFFETVKYLNQGRQAGEVEASYATLLAKRDSLRQTQAIVSSQNKMILGLSSKMKEVEMEMRSPSPSSLQQDKDKEARCSTPSSEWNEDASNISKQSDSWMWEQNCEDLESHHSKDNKDHSNLMEYKRRMEELQDLENQFREIVNEFEGGHISFDEIQDLEVEVDLGGTPFPNQQLRIGSYSTLDSHGGHSQHLDPLDMVNIHSRPRRYSEPSRNWNIPKDSPEYLMRGSRSPRTESLSERDPNMVQPIPCLIAIPSYALRGTGSASHYEYEIKIALGMDQWTIYRRYKRFRELHHFLKNKYEQVKLPYFPPRKLFGSKSERVVQDRQKHLESYLRLVFASCFKTPGTPISKVSSRNLGRQDLYELAPFFRKGSFESSKHSSG